nr:cyclin-dependent kinase c-2 [Quercus suber]
MSGFGVDIIGLGLAQSSVVAILVVVDTLGDDDVVFSLVVASVRVVCASKAEVLIDEGVSVAEVVGNDAVEPRREFKLTTESSYTTQIDLIFRINPGQLNVEEYPSWGSKSVNCFEKLE